MRELDVTRAKILGVLIQDAREFAGRSPADCARALGVDEASVLAAEAGTHFLSLPQLEVLAMYLDVPMSHFWGDQALEQPRRIDFADFINLRDRMVGAKLQQARLEARREREELAEELDVPVETIAAYETGETAVPFFHLERLGRFLGAPLAHFADDAHGPLARHEVAQKVRQRFDELPPALQEFVTNPTNRSYLETAQRLSELDVDRLRNIAEGILDITF